MRNLALVFLIFYCALSLPQDALAATKRDVTIMADPSLIVPINQIARSYARQYHIPVSTVFGNSNEQVEKIERGEEADVFIAAKTLWIKQLQTKGLIDVYSRTPIIKNRLALAASPFQAQPIKIVPGMMAKDFLRPRSDLMIALGDPEYTAEGTYALESLNTLNLTAELEPYYVFFKNIKQLAKTIADFDIYGILFSSDIALYPQIRLIDEFSPEAHTPITYQAVVVTGENMEGARHFLSFLKSDAAQEIFLRYGFDPLG
jgi:molybdate transport system substrate-binding protein